MAVLQEHQSFFLYVNYVFVFLFGITSGEHQNSWDGICVHFYSALCLNVVSTLLVLTLFLSLSCFWVILRALILLSVAVGGTYCIESFIIHLHVLHGPLRLFSSVFPVFTTRWVVCVCVCEQAIPSWMCINPCLLSHPLFNIMKIVEYCLIINGMNFLWICSPVRNYRYTIYRFDDETNVVVVPARFFWTGLFTLMFTCRTCCSFRVGLPSKCLVTGVGFHLQDCLLEHTSSTPVSAYIGIIAL